LDFAKKQKKSNRQPFRSKNITFANDFRASNALKGQQLTTQGNALKGQQLTTQGNTLGLGQQHTRITNAPKGQKQ